MSESQIIKWNELIVNNSYTIKNIQDDSTFTGDFVINNLKINFHYWVFNLV